MNKDLSALVEEVNIAWINDITTHGQDTGIIPANVRKFSLQKFNDDGTLDDVTLPCIIVAARRIQQLHTQLATWLFETSIWLLMQSDDTNEAKWNQAAGALETIYSATPLESYLSGESDEITVQGVVTRNMGGKSIEDRHWKQLFGVQLWACPAR